MILARDGTPAASPPAPTLRGRRVVLRPVADADIDVLRSILCEGIAA